MSKKHSVRSEHTFILYVSSLWKQYLFFSSLVSKFFISVRGQTFEPSVDTKTKCSGHRRVNTAGNLSYQNPEEHVSGDTNLLPYLELITKRVSPEGWETDAPGIDALMEICSFIFYRNRVQCVCCVLHMTCFLPFIRAHLSCITNVCREAASDTTPLLFRVVR